MIKIYKLNASTSEFTELSSGDFTEPLRISSVPGGNAVTKKLYIRNDDNTKYYTDIMLRPATITGSPVLGSVLKVKLLSGDAMPAESRWSSVGWNGPEDGADETSPSECAVLQAPLEGGAIDTRLPDLGAENAPNTNYYPFWVRVESAKSCPVGGSLNLGFLVSYTEHLV